MNSCASWNLPNGRFQEAQKLITVISLNMLNIRSKLRERFLYDPLYLLSVMFITKFDNFNVSGYQLTSEYFSNDTLSVSCMCFGSNIRVTDKSDVGSSELLIN